MTWATKQRADDSQVQAGAKPKLQPDHPLSRPQALILAQDELKRVDARIRSILMSYDEHQSKSEKDRAELKTLRNRSATLKSTLGFVA